jgi:dihydroxy-acid dehydratase
VTIQDVFEAVGKHASGKMTDVELKELEDHACPGPGACGGQFTANTMAIAFEFLGIHRWAATGYLPWTVGKMMSHLSAARW